MQDTQPALQERIFPIVMGFWRARTLAVATELSLAGPLAEGPLDVDQLAGRSQANTSALFRAKMIKRFKSICRNISKRMSRHADRRVNFKH